MFFNLQSKTLNFCFLQVYSAISAFNKSAVFSHIGDGMLNVEKIFLYLNNCIFYDINIQHTRK